MISDKNFNITTGTAKIFPSDITIKSKSYVRVFIDVTGLGQWEIVDENSYNLVNDSLVFTTAPTGTYLTMQVATTIGELLQTPTDNTIILALRGDIIAVVDSLDIISIVAGGLPNINIVATNISEIVDLATALSIIQIVHDNLTDINSFANTYYISDIEPTLITHDSLSAGDLWYNTTIGSLNYYNGTTWDTMAITDSSINTFTNKTLDSISNFIGANHIHYPVRNNSGALIPKGTVITSSATQPGTDYLLVEPVTDPQTQIATGIVHLDIPDNGTGLAINTGVCLDMVDTSAWDEGTILYPNDSGGLTDIKPTTGVYQACAVVTRSHATQGTLIVEFTEPKKVNWDDRYYTEAEVDAIVPLAINRPIDYVTKSGYNHMAMLIGGELYTTAGSTASYGAHTTGRGTTGQNPFYGIDALKKVSIPDASPIIKAGGGYNSFAYALLSNGNLYTWGLNNVGQCGLGHTSAVAVPTLADTNVVDVYDSPNNGEHDIALNRLFIKKTDGYIYGTGYNGNGGLGLGDTVDRNVFTKITSLGNTVTGFWNMGSKAGCAVAQKADNTIWVTGYNGQGQLGTETTTTLTTFTDVTTAWGGAVPILKVTGAFAQYTTAQTLVGILLILKTNGELRTCGYGAQYGLGNGTTTDISTPYLIPTLVVDDVAFYGSLGGVHILVGTDLYAWGRNTEGQLGDGTSTTIISPTLVMTNTTKLLSDQMASHLYGYLTTTFIEKTDGYIYACGQNGLAGMAGIGSSTTANITNFSRVLLPYNGILKDLGHFSTSNANRVIIAITTDNKAYAWGYNANNGITADSTINCLVPVQVNLPKD